MFGFGAGWNFGEMRQHARIRRRAVPCWASASRRSRRCGPMSPPSNTASTSRSNRRCRPKPVQKPHPPSTSAAIPMRRSIGSSGPAHGGSPIRFPSSSSRDPSISCVTVPAVMFLQRCSAHAPPKPGFWRTADDPGFDQRRCCCRRGHSTNRSRGSTNSLDGGDGHGKQPFRKSQRLLTSTVGLRRECVNSC